MKDVLIPISQFAQHSILVKLEAIRQRYLNTQMTDLEMAKSVPPLTEWEGVHIAFGADPVGVCEASCLYYLLNQWMDSEQSCTHTLLGQQKEKIRFW